jgi:flagellar motor switch protein FliN/FliY
MREQITKGNKEATMPLSEDPRFGAGLPAGRVDDTLPAGIGIHTPDFSPLRDSGPAAPDASIQRFLDVSVTVTAELGRITMPIGQLLQLGEGSVVELNHPVTGPIDLVANGVRIARGEVVVVDDCFAIQIKQIEPQGKRVGQRA